MPGEENSISTVWVVKWESDNGLMKWSNECLRKGIRYGCFLRTIECSRGIPKYSYWNLYKVFVNL